MSVFDGSLQHGFLVEILTLFVAYLLSGSFKYEYKPMRYHFKRLFFVWEQAASHLFSFRAPPPPPWHLPALPALCLEFFSVWTIWLEAIGSSLRSFLFHSLSPWFSLFLPLVLCYLPTLSSLLTSQAFILHQFYIPTISLKQSSTFLLKSSCTEFVLQLLGYQCFNICLFPQSKHAAIT